MSTSSSHTSGDRERPAETKCKKSASGRGPPSPAVSAAYTLDSGTQNARHEEKWGGGEGDRGDLTSHCSNHSPEQFQGTVPFIGAVHSAFPRRHRSSRALELEEWEDKTLAPRHSIKTVSEQSGSYPGGRGPRSLPQWERQAAQAEATRKEGLCPFVSQGARYLV